MKVYIVTERIYDSYNRPVVSVFRTAAEAKAYAKKSPEADKKVIRYSPRTMLLLDTIIKKIDAWQPDTEDANSVYDVDMVFGRVEYLFSVQELD